MNSGRTGQASIKKMQSDCDAFNASNPVGTGVSVKLDGRADPFITVTTSDAQILSGHSAVIWLQGVSGCYLLSHVTPLSNIESAINLLGIATKGSFDIDSLLGPRASDIRGNLMKTLFGYQLPAAKCGINSLRDRLYEVTNIPEASPASRRAQFIEYCKQHATKNTEVVMT